LNWVIAFALLLRRGAKCSPRVLVPVSAAILMGHWTDLYLAIMPPILGARPSLGPLEIGLVGWAAGLFGLALVILLRISQRACTTSHDALGLPSKHNWIGDQRCRLITT
jgi:hypothetical protein